MVRNFNGSTQRKDSVDDRPVQQFTTTGQQYVRATIVRHFWGRVLDGTIFLAAFGLLALLIIAIGSGVAQSSNSRPSVDGDGVLPIVLLLLWFVSLYVYGMIWGTWGLVGDRASRMRSVRLKDGSISGPWIGGIRAILWSFLPVYVFFFIATLIDGGFDYTPRYVPINWESGLAKAHRQHG